MRRREGNVRAGYRGGKKPDPAGPWGQGELVRSDPKCKGNFWKALNRAPACVISLERPLSYSLREGRGEAEVSANAKICRRWWPSATVHLPCAWNP